MKGVHAYNIVLVRLGTTSRLEFIHYVDLDDDDDFGLNLKLFPGWRVSDCENVN